MKDWLGKAAECLPDLEEVVTRGQSLSGPAGLWSDLYLELVKAYDVSPINEDLIGRIYDFAAWCLSQPNTSEVDTDVSSAVAVAFIEDLPLDQRIAGDLHRWMSVETLKGLEKLFRYHLSDEEYRKFFEDFVRMRDACSMSPRI